ncbi:MAG: AI-2E family transporter [Ferruginibacter sp.]|nr:AI-2E family transporter [Cytophagales bacterium]
MKNKLTFPRKAGVASLIALLITALFLLVGYAADFFLLLFGGILIGVLLSALSHLISDRTRISYGISLVVVLLLLVLLIGGTVWLLAPSVGRQADELSQSLPEALKNVETRLNQSSWGKQILRGIPKNPGEVASGQKEVVSRLTGVFSSTLGIIANLVILLITGIYLASDPGSYQNGFAKLFNPDFRPRLLGVMDQCYHTLSAWLLSRFISMVVVGVATVIGLSVLGIPLAGVLAIIAAFFNFIPNIGPYLALIPALPIAYLQSPEKALYLFLLYSAIQTLEGYILTPLLDKKLVSTPPALLLFGQVLLGILVGISGVLLASPLIAVLIVLVNELYVKDHLEKQRVETVASA